MESFTSLFLTESLTQLWSSVLVFLPRLVAVFSVILAGIIVASICEQIVLRVVTATKLQGWVDRYDWQRFFGRGESRVSLANVLGWLSKWSILLVAAVVVTQILGWRELTLALQGVVSYIPSVVLAIVILLAGSFLANAAKSVILSSLVATDISSATVFASVARWAILLFSVLAALLELDIAPELIRMMFAGTIFMLALAGGLAFGLGGKEHAARLLSRIEQEWEQKP